MTPLRVAAIGWAMLRFGLGVLLGIPIALLVAPVSFARRQRAVHFDGVICRALLTPESPLGSRLAGPALVRFSGALEDTQSISDILGATVRFQEAVSDDPRVGDQDLLFGTFESFFTAARDRQRTIAGDYLANAYSTVTPWWLAGHGLVVLRLRPVHPAADADTATRNARLEAAIKAGRAQFHVMLDDAPIATLTLTALLDDAPGLCASMSRCGRGIRPLGFRNGIRATVYPLSQAARRQRNV